MNLHANFDIPIAKNKLKTQLETLLFDIQYLYLKIGKLELKKKQSSSGQISNKLCNVTYRLLKSDFGMIGKLLINCKNILPLQHRASFSKCSVAPLSWNGGRYEGIRVAERKCPFGNCTCIEDESRVLFECPVCQDLRQKLVEAASIFNLSVCGR